VRNLVSNLSIVVVIYNCEINESNTLNSIANSSINYKNTVLVIWNNGPNLLHSLDITSLKEKGISVYIQQTIDNISLAKIYNQFIKENSSQYYLILDDDSLLNNTFLNKIKQLNTISIALPIIKSNDTIVSPIKNRRPVNTATETCTNRDRVMAIGSGIILSKSICDYLIDEYGDIFDEKFFLYGVDSSFFFRIREQCLTKSITFIEGFNHSLSANEQESDDIKQFRLIESFNGKALIVHHYCGYTKRYIKAIKILIKIILSRKKREANVHYLNALITGKHFSNRL
jgi:hypothetical protein